MKTRDSVRKENAILGRWVMAHDARSLLVVGVPALAGLLSVFLQKTG